MRTVLLLLLVLIAPVIACAQSFPGIGNGSGAGNATTITYGNGGGCYPLTANAAAGNNSANPYPTAYTNLVGDTGIITHKGFAGNALSGGGIVFSMMTKATFADPCNSPNIIVAMDQACNNNAGVSNCASVPTVCGTATLYCTEPAVLIYNAATNTVVADTTLIDTDANGSSGTASAACHDCNSEVYGISPGGVGITYGAYTIGINQAPAAWAAFNSTGGASGGTACTNCAAQPIIYGQNLNAASDPQSFLCRSSCAGGATSNKGFLPAIGLSELGCAQTFWGVGGIVMCSGQTQKGTTFNVDVGIQGVLLGHIICTGAANCIRFDTQCGEQTPLTATTALCNGIYQISSKAYFDVWATFSVATVTNTAGQTLNFNPPGAAACGSNIVVTTTGTTTTQAAIDAAAAYNADSTHSCPNTRYKLKQVSNASWQPQCPAVTTACIAVLDENGDPNLDASSIGAATCAPGGPSPATAFTCSATTNYKGNLNLNTSFSFGTIRSAPQLCNNCFVQLGSVELDTNLVSGAYSSNYDNALYLFLIQPNASGHGFKYCSIDGYNCILTDLTTLGGATPQSVLRLMGGGGVGTVATQTNCTGGCLTGGSDPLENMPSNWCSNSVTPIGTAFGTTNCQVGTAGGSGSANPFLVRCPISSTGTNLPACGTNAPFQYSWTTDAQATAESAHGGMVTAGRDLGFDGLGLGSSYVHITYYGASTSGSAGSNKGAVNDLRINTLNRQVTLAQIGLTAASVSQNAGVNVSNATGPSGTMYVTWGTGDAGAMNFGTGMNCTTVSGTCLARCTSTSYTAFGNCSVLVARSAGANVLAARNAIYDMPDGFAVLDLYAVMNATTCTLGTNCDYGLYLHALP